jgi:hypothetical protein
MGTVRVNGAGSHHQSATKTRAVATVSGTRGVRIAPEKAFSVPGRGVKDHFIAIRDGFGE